MMAKQKPLNYVVARLWADRFKRPEMRGMQNLKKEIQITYIAGTTVQQIINTGDLRCLRQPEGLGPGMDTMNKADRAFLAAFN